MGRGEPEPRPGGRTAPAAGPQAVSAAEGSRRVLGWRAQLPALRAPATTLPAAPVLAAVQLWPHLALHRLPRRHLL